MFRHYGMGADAAAAAVQPEPGYYYESAILAFDKVLALSAEYLNQAVSLDGDADFMLEQLAAIYTSSSFQVRFKAPNGRPLSNAYINALNLIGTGQFPVYLPAPVWYPAGGQIGLDIKETSGSQNTIQIALIGIKRFKV